MGRGSLTPAGPTGLILPSHSQGCSQRTELAERSVPWGWFLPHLPGTCSWADVSGSGHCCCPGVPWQHLQSRLVLQLSRRCPHKQFLPSSWHASGRTTSELSPSGEGSRASNLSLSFEEMISRAEIVYPWAQNKSCSCSFRGCGQVTAYLRDRVLFWFNLTDSPVCCGEALHNWWIWVILMKMLHYWMLCLSLLQLGSILEIFPLLPSISLQNAMQQGKRISFQALLEF